ncbi:cohesin domain-containing protein [Halorubrum sp. DTA98]|uniref:cohesin domain-containing protein n=1 Tax=Halorubrum sp. DTA98 TaxID=3402163 RepID=UPI003AAD7042
MIRRRTLAVSLLLACVLAGGLVAPALAADNPGLLGFDPSEAEADPGETVDVNVWFRAMAGYSDDGVRSVEYVVAYDPEVLTATNVETGPWMSRGDETDVTHDATIDEDAGRVTVEQARDPPAGGVGDTGENRTPTATITFEVEDDAPPSDAVVRFAEANAMLLEYPLPVLTTREAVVVIDGGGEERRPTDSVGDDGGDGDSPGVTLADDEGDGDEATDEATDDPDESDRDDTGDGPAGDEAVDDETTDNETTDDETTDDETPGLGVPAALVAVAIAAALGARRRE